jgi:hypothetical protein
MFVRVMTAAVMLLAAAAGPAMPEQLNADGARRFVVGKVFAYSCFDGTRGAGRIQGDLSVAGTIQIKGTGPVRFVTLPPGTLRVKGEAVCASVRGVPFEPCFNVDKTANNRFRGSVKGFNFAYCDFVHRAPRKPSVRTTFDARQPQPIQSAAATPATGP